MALPPNVSQAAFNAALTAWRQTVGTEWVFTSDEDIALYRTAVYEHWCAPCHAPGPGHPGTQSLQIKYAGKTAPVLLDRADLSPQAVAAFVRQGILSMPPFRKTEITDVELAALAAYVSRNFKAK